MKNKYSFVLLFLFIIFFMIGCKSENDNMINMIVQEDTITATGLKVSISDKTDNDNEYGDYFRIEKEINNNWKEVQKINNNYVFTDIAYSVIDKQDLELTCNWEYIYGKLEPGEYRIVKKINSEDEIFAKFIIKSE